MIGYLRNLVMNRLAGDKTIDPATVEKVIQTICMSARSAEVRVEPYSALAMFHITLDMKLDLTMVASMESGPLQSDPPSVCPEQVVITSELLQDKEVPLSLGRMIRMDGEDL